MANETLSVVKDTSLMVQDLLRHNVTINNKLDFLRTKRSVPTLGIIIKMPSKWLSARDHYVLFFVCEHTLLPVPCGPEGRGFHFKRLKSSYRSRLQKIAPIITFGLVVATIVVTIYGIPVPLPGVVDVHNTISKDETQSASVIKSMLIDLGKKDVINRIHELGKQDPHLKDQINQIIGGLDQLSEDQHKLWQDELKELSRNNSLFGLDTDHPNYGLVQVTNRSGLTKWINPVVKDEFKAT